jgi:hypothetical protein
MIRTSEDMKIKKLIKYYLLGESIKEIELNRILDKIGSGKKLNKKEIGFLNLYQETREDLMKDFMYLSKNSVYSKTKDLMESGKKVICDLSDRNGKFGLEIINLQNNFEEDECIILMKGGETHKLEDRFLYNLIYKEKKGQYSLQEQDEYFEKIEAGNDND